MCLHIFGIHVSVKIEEFGVGKGCVNQARAYVIQVHFTLLHDPCQKWFICDKSY